VQRPETVEPDPAVEGVEERLECRRIRDVVAGGPEMAGVEADAEPRMASEPLDQRRQLLQ
jgi:hypothetical protein